MIRNFADHASNERTFLAWVRTVIAMVGFGIGASRLGGIETSPWVDAVVLGAGGLVVVLAYLRMRLVRKRIDSPGRSADEAAEVDVALTILVLAFFLLLAAFTLRLSV